MLDRPQRHDPPRPVGTADSRAPAAAGPYKPYMIRESLATPDEIFRYVNEQIYIAYSSNYEHGGAEKIVASSLYEYEALLKELSALDRFEFVTHYDLLREPCPPDRVRVGIRHDVDMDIVEALQQAELEHRYGAVTTWVILHTAVYYGYFSDDVFYRHRCMAHFYRRLQELGHEVSLHTDPLMIYQTHGIDGAQALVTELEWLRSEGIVIRGTTAHNHRPVYGAENFEIFKGYARPGDLESGQPLPTFVEHNGRTAPLRVLDECALGLEYEGNQVFWQKHTPIEYGAIRAADRWNWRAHARRMERDPTAVDGAFIDQARMLAEIKSMARGSYLVLVVHPVYHGNRDAPDRAPLLRANRIVTRPDERLGWMTYDPAVTQCWSGPRDCGQEFQAIHKPNVLGMLDRPATMDSATDVAAAAPRHIVFLGADNLDGLPVPVPVQVPSVFAELVERCCSLRIRTTKLAFPAMGISRLWGWYKALRNDLRADIVVLGIGDQSLRQNVPAAWSRETGISHRYPAGDYLRYDGKSQAVCEILKSFEWRRHIRDPQPLTHAARAADLSRALGALRVPRVDGANGMELLEGLYARMCAEIRSDGATPVLLLEANGETAGPFDGNDDAGARAAFAAAVRRRITRLAAKLEVPLADPYALFATEAGGLPTHYPHDGRWNPTGHRLAAKALLLTWRSAGLLSA